MAGNRFIRDMQPEVEFCGVRIQIWGGALFTLALAFTSFYLRTDEQAHFDNPVPGSASANAQGDHAVQPIVSTPSFQHHSAPVLTTALLQKLSDPEATVRLQTLHRLQALELADDELLPILTACLADRDPAVRAFAADQMGQRRIAAAGAVPALKLLAKTDTDEWVRSRAREALLNIRIYDYSPIGREF